ncbi:MFS transporter [Flavisolibacter ginsenosidimutans]|uniref:MFS transporter n=1 Tax=Flavisolibacter ginsenosidimutans TaxID=661481 RepID=UPI0037438C41
MASSSHTAAPSALYRGTDKLILGIVLAVITFWLFAQTTLNIAPVIGADIKISHNVNSLAVSITALFSGIFIVIAGGLADKIGRVKITYLGLLLNIVGSSLLVVSPSGTAAFLLAGRILLGLSAACIMPATLALCRLIFKAKNASGPLVFGPLALGAARVFALCLADLLPPPLAGAGFLFSLFLWPSSVICYCVEHPKAKQKVPPKNRLTGRDWLLL